MLDEIGEYSSLQTLDLSFNEIPIDEFMETPNLKILDLAENKLAGEIPRLIYRNEVIQYLQGLVVFVLGLGFVLQPAYWEPFNIGFYKWPLCM
ncbi:hypothetical protein MKW98_010065 [Papaver atlanticum]|uniref:Uncharacterized protein n=1 Tax=Papaver atlanticum TaxID=357466 RepID=A0AAD4X5G6_9MAGN|nr:hypothetical protein MKW98_010065 [Papaver atlanticum]